METIDDEVLAHASDFIERQADADTPFFCWFNTTHMHFRTHPKPESVGQAGRWQSPYHDTMIDHDKVVGALLDQLDELGLAEDTIVIYSTDNGPHMNTWPDGGHDAVPQREEHQLGGRVPRPADDPLARPDPGRARSPTRSSSHHDWLPTFLAAAGEPDIVEKLKAGHTIGDTTYKVHIDGYDLLPYLTGEAEESPRPGFIYFSDDGDVLALRFDNWKVVFMEQRCPGTLQIWAEPFVDAARAQALQPADRPVRARRHHVEHLLGLAADQRLPGPGRRRRWSARFLETFKEFPPRQKAASFTIDQAWRSSKRSMTAGPMSASRSLLERRRREGGDPRLRRARDRRGRARSRAARRPHRRLRQRRHAVVRAAGLRPGAVHPRPAARAGRGGPGAGARSRSSRRCWPATSARHMRRARRRWSSVLLSTHAGLTAEEFATVAAGWLAEARHPRFARPFADLVYAPMLELIDAAARRRLPRLHRHRRRRRVRARGERAALRRRPDDVVGSAVEVGFERRDGRVVLVRQAKLLGSPNEGEPKAINIQAHIGRRPIFAAGNSAGDREMLEYAHTGEHPSLCLVVDHDDAEREYAYAGEAVTNPDAEPIADTAARFGWTVVSMRDDWSRVFAEPADDEHVADETT